MRRIIYTSFLILLFLHILKGASAQCDQAFIDQCASNSEVKYIKHFRIRFTESQKDKSQSEGQFSIMLNKGNHYRFLVCNDPTKPGSTIIELSSDFGGFGGNYNASEDKEYKAFDFVCSKTGPYYLKMFFKNGEEGCGVCVVSLVMQ